MIPEIPVLTRQVLDVRTHRHEAPTATQATANLIQRTPESRLVRKVLEKIAGENDIERFVRQRPTLRTVLLQEPDIAVQKPRYVRIEVHGKSFTALNRVDELAVPRTEIQ